MEKTDFRRDESPDRADQNLEILIHSWNSTIWQADLGNDTCFKVAFLFRSFLKNSAKVDAFTNKVFSGNPVA
jgi:beta-xylosidase